MQSPISIVIATRNRGAQLRSCLVALRASALPPGWCAEIIVVDNGSTDDTAGVVASFQAAPGESSFHYLTEPHQGKSFAVNRGLSVARGSIVAFVDDDVLVDARWIAEIIEQFRCDPELGVLAGRVVSFEPHGRHEGVTVGVDEAPLDVRQPLLGHVMGCNLAIRREVINVVGGRDTRLGPGRGLSAEDIDFVYRILKAGFRGRFSPRPTVVHKPGPRNRRLEYLRGRGAYYAKYVSRGDLVIARQAWWEFVRIWQELKRPRPERTGSPLADLRNLLLGASVMVGRLVTSRRPLRLTR